MTAPRSSKRVESAPRRKQSGTSSTLHIVPDRDLIVKRIRELSHDTFDTIMEKGRLLDALNFKTKKEYNRLGFPFEYSMARKYIKVGTCDLIDVYRDEMPEGIKALHQCYLCTPDPPKRPDLFIGALEEGIIHPDARWYDILAWRKLMEQQSKENAYLVVPTIPDPLENQIVCVDAFVGMAAIPDKSVNLVLSDLPYGETENKWDKPLLLPELWTEIERILTPDGVVVFTASDPYSHDLATSKRSWYRYMLPTLKRRGTQFLNSGRRVMAQHDYVLIFAPKGEHTFNPQMKNGKHYRVERKRGSNSTNYSRCDAPSVTDTNERCPSTADCPPLDAVSRQELIHPTQKSVEAFRYLIRQYSNPGDIVLDMCAGSGTTGVACHLEGRRYILFENDPEMWGKAKERIETESR